MSFSDQMKKFAENAKQKIAEKQVQAVENAKVRLEDVLGDDAKLITAISLDADVGKFYNVQAPTHVIERLRTANLLRD